MVAASNHFDQNLFLVGPMGVGKTTIGRLLAQELGLRFIDSDHEIEKRAGANISWIFDVEGEPTKFAIRRPADDSEAKVDEDSETLRSAASEDLEDGLQTFFLQWGSCCQLRPSHPPECH